MQAFSGRFLTTFKLHLAAIHLPDQIRLCGPGYLHGEYWIERMVQLVKRMVKYRSTAYPELLFVHDWLLTLACRRVKLTNEGHDCLSLDEALAAVRKKKQSNHDTAGPNDALLLGAPKPISATEEREVLPTGHRAVGDGELKGLPYLLLNDRTLSREGWPSLPDDHEAVRPMHILKSLGLEGPLGAGEEGVAVDLTMFARADLPIGETISSVLCKSQKKKNNQWCLIQYQIEDQAGAVVERLYVCHFMYFMRAQLKRSGVAVGAEPVFASRPLKLGIAKLYECKEKFVPGVRPADADLQRLHEFVEVADVRPVVDNAAYAGVYALDLRTIDSQIVPTKERFNGRFFSIASKLSGRTAGVKR